jgi:hypothetical protein
VSATSQCGSMKKLEGPPLTCYTPKSFGQPGVPTRVCEANFFSYFDLFNQFLRSEPGQIFFSLNLVILSHASSSSATYEEVAAPVHTSRSFSIVATIMPCRSGRSRAEGTTHEAVTPSCLSLLSHAEGYDVTAQNRVHTLLSLSSSSLSFFHRLSSPWCGSISDLSVLSSI